MADLPTPQELAQTGAGVYRVAIDPTGTGAVDTAAGSRTDTALGVLAALAARVQRYAADRAGAARRQTATGADLDVLAADLYGEARKPAAASTTTVYLVRAAGGLGATSIPAGSRFGVPAAGAQPAVAFAATADVAAGSGVTRIAVDVACTQTGPAGNVAQAAITAILDPLPDANWSTYVPAPSDPYYPPDVVAGGADAELDDPFRARLAQVSPDAERTRGTRDAILAGALRVPGVGFATPVEPGDGTVALFVGDASYQLSAALRAAVATELEAWRAFGVPVQLRPYAATRLAISLVVHMARPTSAYDAAQVAADATAAVLAYMADRPRPEEYFVDALAAAAFRAHDEVQHVVVALPTADAPRPADATYGGVTSLVRYYADAASVSVVVAGPTTS